MLKRVLDGLLKKNNRQSFKISTTDGYYYQIEFEQHPKININHLASLSYAFTEALLAYTQKHNTTEHQHLVKFLNQLASEPLSAGAIRQYLLKNFAFEPWVTLNTAQGRILEGSFDAQQSKFFLKKPPVLFKYQFLFSMASLLYYSLQQMNANQIAEFDKKLNHKLDGSPYLMVKAG